MPGPPAYPPASPPKTSAPAASPRSPNTASAVIRANDRAEILIFGHGDYGVCTPKCCDGLLRPFPVICFIAMLNKFSMTTGWRQRQERPSRQSEASTPPPAPPVLPADA